MNELDPVLEFVRRNSKCDIGAYNDATLERCLGERLSATGNKDIPEYLAYLHHRPDEMDKLLNVLTINYSHFFRETLTFEYIEQIIFPAMFAAKRSGNDRMIRIWSAGCAGGEEPYSIAILVKHLIEKEDLKIMVFGTDVDESALAMAREGSFSFEAVKHMKYELVEKYFIREAGRFKIAPEIKQLVVLARHDLTDAGSKVPSESVYGDFDMVFCRNVLIYLRGDAQKCVIKRLHHSLAPGGVLVLGRAEDLLPASWGDLRKVSDACPIWKKEAVSQLVTATP